MGAGRPRQIDPGSLYAFAHQFYWDFRRLAEGGIRHRIDQQKYKQLIQEVKDSNLDLATLDSYNRAAIEESRKELRIPGEPDVVNKLLTAKTPDAIRKICEDAPNWPISSLGVLPYHLARHAEEFIIAKNDRRFPCSRRPSSQLKQFWFLSRALAGAVFGVKTRTAINLVGSKRPEQSFEESRAAKPTRKRTKKRRRS